MAWSTVTVIGLNSQGGGNAPFWYEYVQTGKLGKPQRVPRHQGVARLAVFRRALDDFVIHVREVPRVRHVVP
jgi:hypothetical protein